MEMIPFSPSPVGEGWEGGNSNLEFTMFVLAEKNWSIGVIIYDFSIMISAA
jgi:hypothetical protein